MPKRKLDAAFCQAVTCEAGKKKTDYWDTTVSGFTLEVRQSGGKTYYLRYFDDRGRQRQLKIGKAEIISFSQAKERAKKLRSEVELNGDPAKEKERKKAVPVYAELAKQHLEHARTYQKRPENTESVIDNHLLPRWGKLRLDEIKQQDIAKWLAEKRRELAPATVEKLRMTLGRSFELGMRWEIPGAEINPVRGIPRFKFDNKRNRFLTANEAQRLLAEADKSLCTQLGSIIRLLLLTGARRSELLKAEWSNVDLERKAWFIPDSKTGKSRHVPLSSEAIKVIEALPRFPNCPFLIPNPKTRKPYDQLKRPWDTVCRRAALGNLRIHDLRHSAASFMINAGIDLFAVGRVLGHADHQSTMRYSHLANDTLMAAVEAGAACLAKGGNYGI